MKDCQNQYYTQWAALCTLTGKKCPPDNDNCKDYRKIANK